MSLSRLMRYTKVGCCCCVFVQNHSRLVVVPQGKEDKIAVVVGTITDDPRLEEVRKVTVCALRFTATARARIEKVRTVLRVLWRVFVVSCCVFCFVRFLVRVGLFCCACD